MGENRHRKRKQKIWQVKATEKQNPLYIVTIRKGNV